MEPADLPAPESAAVPSPAEPLAPGSPLPLPAVTRAGTFVERVGPVLAALQRWLPLTLVLGVCPGLFVWPMLHLDRLTYLVDNKLDLSGKRWLLASMAISLVLMGGGSLAWGLFQRARGQELAAVLERLNRRLLFLLALPVIPALFLKGIEAQWPKLTLFLAAYLASVAVVWAYQLPAFSLRAGRAFVPLLIVVALALGYALLFSFFSVTHHHNLATKIHDLGIYDSIFWHNLRGELLGTNYVKSGSHIAAHVDPILILLSPIYLLYPRAESILVLQSVWLASGAIPIFVLARKKLDAPWLAVALAAIYLLYPALHGANLYDFHSLSLIGPLLPWAIYFLETGAVRRYAVVIALLLLCREDVSLLCAMIGIYAIASGKGVRLGGITIGVAVVYLLFVKLAIMPDASLLMKDSKTTYSYAYYYKDLIPAGGEGARGLLTSLLTNPIYVLQVVLTEEKLLFFVKLFLPLLFLPLFVSRKGWLLLVYGFAFLFLASRTAVYSLHFQYPVVLYPLAMALVPLGLAELSGRRIVELFRLEPSRLQQGLVAGMLAASVVVSAKYGALLKNDSFRPGNLRFERSSSPEQEERYAWVRQAIDQIPPDASVAATDHLGPHVSNRKSATNFPWGKTMDYLLLDTGNMDAKARKRYEDATKGGAYEKLSERKGLVLWRRVTGTVAPPPGEEE